LLLLLLLGVIILILQLLPTLGLWRGRVLSCSNLRVPCIGFESLLGVRFSSEVQSISPLSSCSTYSTVAPVLIDAQGTKLIAVLCRLVLTYRMVAPVLIDAQGTKPRISSKTEALGIHPIPPQSTSADPLTTSFKDTNRFCFTAPNHGSYPIPYTETDKLSLTLRDAYAAGQHIRPNDPNTRRMELSTNRYCSRNSGTTAN
jgi:hypothetical protein